MKSCKHLLAALLLVAIAALLTGCHGTRELSAFRMPEAFDDSKPLEITFWAKNDTNKAQTEVYQRAIDTFEAQYPNVTVNLRLYTDYGKIYNDVITNISTGTTPNVCITYPDHIATYLSGSNVVVPLDDLLVDETYGLNGTEAGAPGEIIPEYLEECAFSGHYYAVPFMRSTEVCYVNKTYVEALGYTLPDVLTWDFVWEVSEAAMAKNDDGTFKINGQNVMIPFIYKSTDNMMIQMLRQLDAEYSTQDGQILLFNDVTRWQLLTIANHARTGAFSTFKISSYPANFLNAGQCIFAVDSTGGSTWMGTEAPLCDISEDKIVNFETAVRMVPQYDAQRPQMISQGPSVCIFNKSNSQEVLASWLFVRHLLSDEVQIAYAKTEGYVPVTAHARSNAAYLDYLSRAGEDSDEHYRTKIEATQLLIEHVEDTFVTPVFNGSASLRDAAGQLIESVTKSVRRKQNIDDAYLDKLFADTASLYRLDQQETSDSDSEDLGPLPNTAKLLLGVLALAWVAMGLFALFQWRKRKSNAK